MEIKEYDKLASDGKYNEAIALLRKEILNNPDDPYLKYKIFLYSNDNYIIVNDDPKNEIDFHEFLAKLESLGKNDEKEFYENEFIMYHNLPDANMLGAMIRYAKLENYAELYKNFILITNEESEVSVTNSFMDSLNIYLKGLTDSFTKELTLNILALYNLTIKNRVFTNILKDNGINTEDLNFIKAKSNLSKMLNDKVDKETLEKYGVFNVDDVEKTLRKLSIYSEKKATKQVYNLIKNNSKAMEEYIHSKNFDGDYFEEELYLLARYYYKIAIHITYILSTENFNLLLKGYNLASEYLNNSNDEFYNEIRNEFAFYLSVCYSDGIGTTKSKEKCLQYLDIAADFDFNNYKALNNRGVYYAKANDLKNAFLCFEKSANLGGVAGKYNYGICYLNGIGVQMDTDKGLEIIKESAELGDKKSLAKLINYYKNVNPDECQIYQNKLDKILTDESTYILN